MDRTILVGVDGSTGSEDALRWALREARLRARPVTALLAWGSDGLPREVFRRVVRADHETLETAATEALEQAVERVGAGDVDVSRLVVEAPPLVALEKNWTGAEMVVVGSHGHGPVHRVLAGSVAQGAVNHARIPVVVVRGSTDRAPRPDRRPVVVGVDGSRNSVGALRWAARAAALRQAPLRVVHAVGRTEPLYPGLVISGQSDLLRRAQTMLDETVAKGLHHASEVVVDTVVTAEAPTSALLREAADAQLLVVGRRGRGGFADLLLGSVSHQSILHAACPVAVVHDEE
ncbi:MULTISPECIES: universal stress protein [unclassified Parafrankia]|uniref:universal stress protein n=1 Tax=unclassified Parafrankia TaxID=2994368 RepID=UPI000DA4F28B|nr:MULTISPECIES: universal stress protein [unclassified Parafrankia]TCJ35080.1 universal stress protein [Parafrankia sp. BMG5.11]CAI7973739.1 Universal stress protein [Frankia sp. Hr75.2]SQE00097.1 UspA domain protein [Parafrankia sp. Ea1.12]